MNMNRFTHKISLSLSYFCAPRPPLRTASSAMYFAISGSVPRQKAEEHQYCTGLAESKSKNLKNKTQAT